MPTKVFKPTSPGRRGMVGHTFAEITKKKPEKSLLEPLKSKAGRNSQGRISVRHRGGGHKRMYRIIDWKRDKSGVEGTVLAIEYDPNRAARIALVQYADGEKRYMLATVGMTVGAKVLSGTGADPVGGNALPLRSIPTGNQIHNIELRPGQGGKLVRSAGNYATLMAKDGDWAQVRLPSGEVRRIHCDCTATVGQVGNTDHANTKLGKAGRSRWRGIRPHV